MLKTPLEYPLWTHVNQRDSVKNFQRAAIKPIPDPPTGNREQYRPKRAKADEIPEREGEGNGVPNFVTGAGPNAGTFVMFAKNRDDEIGRAHV